MEITANSEDGSLILIKQGAEAVSQDIISAFKVLFGNRQWNWVLALSRTSDNSWPDSFAAASGFYFFIFSPFLIFKCSCRGFLSQLLWEGGVLSRSVSQRNIGIHLWIQKSLSNA